MILVGSQRGGAKNLALHLMKEENEQVELHEVRGFASDTVMGALNEAYALSRGTKCKKFMYSLSLNPPQDKDVTNEDFDSAIEQAEKRLGLEDQPRVIVFHEKNNRRHAHCVWSRINVDEMKAVHISHDHKKLQSLSRELYIHHNWELPKGHIDKSLTDKRNFTLAEWQQAKRIGKDPKAIKTAFQDAWAISDSKASFEHALEERGYKLARGNRRAHMAVDIHGEVHSIARRVGIKTKDVRERLGDEDSLPSIETVKDQIAQGVLPNLERLNKELEAEKQARVKALKDKKAALEEERRVQRKVLLDKQSTRQQAENKKRQAGFRKGLGSLWDRLRGKTKERQERHAEEIKTALKRDKEEQHALNEKQRSKHQAYKDDVQQRKAEYIAKRKGRHSQLIVATL